MTLEAFGIFEPGRQRCPASGPGPDDSRLIEVLARLGPATPYTLAREALLPLQAAMGWLTRGYEAGYLYRDPHTGRYSAWCPLRAALPMAGGPR
jgi:hypothetical protein